MSPAEPAPTGCQVVTLGECLIAFVAASPGPLAEIVSFDRYVAGAEANCAIGLARLGVRVAYIGRVGTDGFGAAITRRLRGEGIDVSCLTADASAPTGILIRERRLLGPAQVHYYRTGSAGSRLSKADIDAASGIIASTRWLHLTGITPALSASARDAVDHAIRLARAAGATISLDLNVRRKLWSESDAATTLRALARAVDIVIGSADEVALVADSDARSPEVLATALLALGPRLGIVKLGADGAAAATVGGTVRASAPEVAAVDAVGAGDAFSAGLIASLLDGETLERSLAAAAACGAAAAAAVGDTVGLLDRSELVALLASELDPGRDLIR